MRDISFWKKNPNTQKPLKNKNSRTQTNEPSQDTRPSVQRLPGKGAQERGELASLPDPAACLQDSHQLAPSIPEGSQAWLCPGAVGVLEFAGMCIVRDAPASSRPRQGTAGADTHVLL